MSQGECMLKAFPVRQHERVILYMLFLLLFLVGCYHPSDPPSPIHLCVVNLYPYSNILHGYAAEHEGRFPVSLSQLKSFSPCSFSLGDSSTFLDPTTGKTNHQWLYFPGHSVNDDPNLPLMATPRAFSHAEGRYKVPRGAKRRVVLFVDGRVEVIDEQAWIQMMGKSNRDK